MVRAAHARFAIATVLPAATVRFFASVMPAAFRYVDFAADDRLDVPFARLVEEIRCGEEIAVVGDGHGWHFLPRSFIQQLRSFAGPVEQAVIGVNVEMYELRLPHGPRF